MTQFSDEDLAAFADGELDQVDAAAISRRAAEDPGLAARIADLVRQRELIRSAFDGVLAEPPPQRLVEAASAGSATILPFRLPTMRRETWRAGLGLAASLTVGIGLGVFGGDLVTGSTPAGQPAAEGQMLIAASGTIPEGAVTRALATARSGVRVDLGDGAGLQAKLTFRDSDGRLCRQFEVSAPDRVMGAIACESDRGWSAEAITGAPARRGEYQLASGGENGVLDLALETLGAGDPLDAASEADALATLK